MSLRERLVILKWFSSPFLCTRIKFKKYLRTSVCACKKGSFTIEASIVVPILATFFALLLYFFRLVQLQSAVEEALYYAGAKTAVESSLAEDEAALYLVAQGHLTETLYENPLVNDYVDGGIWGIHILGSRMDGTDILLQVNYKVHIPFAIGKYKEVQFCISKCFTKWQGDMPGTEEKEWVYITPNGTVYHASPSCRVLELSIHEADKTQIGQMRGKDGQKYYPCSGCVKRDSSQEKVYYTDYGTLYHQSLSCSSLKRTIIKVARSSVQERKECSYCFS